MAAVAYQSGRDNIGIVNAIGCSTVYGSTYPYNPWAVSWTNSLFENAPPMPWACERGGISWAGKASACGSSAATAPCWTSASAA
jgi:hypothetical protein